MLLARTWKIWFVWGLEFLFLCFIPSFSEAQSESSNKLIDSLKHDLIETKTVVEKAEILYNIGLEYQIATPKKSLTYYFQALNLLKGREDIPLFIVGIYQNMASVYTGQNKLNSSDSLYDISVSYASRYVENELFNQLNALKGKALNEFYRGKYDKSIAIYNKIETEITKLDTAISKNRKLKYTVIGNKAMSFARKGDLSKALIGFKLVADFRNDFYVQNKSQATAFEYIGSINNVGLCYKFLDKPGLAIENYLEGLEIAHEQNLRLRIQSLSSNIAFLFNEQGYYQKAIEYGEMAIGESERYNQKAYSALGLSYLNLEGYLKSKDYFRKGIKIANKREDNLALAQLESNLGLLYLELTKIDSASYFFKASLDKYQDAGILNKINMVKSNLGKCYFELGKKKKGLSLLLEAEKGFDKEKVKKLYHVKNKEFIYKVYKELGSFEKSLYWLEKMNVLEHDFGISENQIKITDLETKYQTKEKEAIIQKLTIENQQKEIETQQQKVFAYLGLGGFLLLILGGGFMMFRSKQKQKQQELAHENEMLEIKKDLSQLELSNLNTQLNPHEIKNILASISPEIQRKAPEAYKNLIRLLNITKASIANREITEPVAVQLQQVEDYLSLEQMRRSVPFEFIIKKEESSNHIQIPKLLLKNIVENAVKHGISPGQENDKIVIHIKEQEEYIQINISDSGQGLKNNSKETGIGTSTYRRLFELLNKTNPFKASFRIYYKDNGTQVEVNIPVNYKYS